MFGVTENHLGFLDTSIWKYVQRNWKFLVEQVTNDVIHLHDKQVLLPTTLLLQHFALLSQFFC